MKRNCAFLVQRNGFFGLSSINVLWAVLGGVRHSQNDTEFTTLLQKITKLFRTGNPSGDIIDIIPFLRHLFPDVAGYKDRMIGTVCSQNYFRVSKQ